LGFWSIVKWEYIRRTGLEQVFKYDGERGAVDFRKQKTMIGERRAGSSLLRRDEGREEFAHGVQKVQEGHYSRKRSGSTESAVLYEYQY